MDLLSIRKIIIIMVDGDILYCSDHTIALADMVRNLFPSLRYLVYVICYIVPILLTICNFSPLMNSEYRAGSHEPSYCRIKVKIGHRILKSSLLAERVYTHYFKL